MHFFAPIALAISFSFPLSAFAKLPGIHLSDCLASAHTLCSSYDFGLPVTITSTGSGPALSITGGNVGVGIASPANPLAVAGVIQSTAGGFQFPDGSIQTTAATGGGGGTTSQWTTTGANISYSGGLVGVGTPNPTSPLTVAGTVESTQGGFKFPDGSVQTTASSGGAAAPSQWATSGSSISYQAGNVGIGTSAASSPLTVAGVIQTTAGGVMFPDGTTQSTASIPSQWSSGAGGISFAKGTVAVGTTTATSPLTVAGVVESSSGGFKFPDGSVQTTASTSVSAPPQPWVNSNGFISYSAGNVGIGTNAPTPNVMFDVRGNTAGGSRQYFSDDGSAGNGAGYAWLGFRSGVSEPANLAIGMSSAADGTVNGVYLMTQGQNRFVVDANGNVGIGTNAPSSKMQVMDTISGLTTGAQVRPFHLPGQAAGLVIQATDADTTVKRTLALNPDGGSVAIGTLIGDSNLSVNGSASKTGGGSWNTYSDSRLKTVEGKFTRGMEAIEQLQPIAYHYNDGNPAGVRNDGSHIGFVAQEVKKVIPEAVTESRDGFLMVNNDPIILALLNAVKSDHEQLEKMKREVCAKDNSFSFCR